MNPRRNGEHFVMHYFLISLCANYVQILFTFVHMDTSIGLSLDMRRSKKDGTYPLVMRLGHKQRTTSIPLKINLDEKDWDAKNRIVRKSYKGVDSVTRLNNIIQKKKSSNRSRDSLEYPDAPQRSGRVFG